MNNIIKIILIIILLNVACYADELRLSTNTIQINKGERIVGLNIKISYATFIYIYGLHNGWNVNIDNNPSWSSEIKSEIIVGAAALNLTEVGKIKFGFETMDYQQTDKLDINGIIYVTKDFEKTREIRLRKGNFIIKESKH